MPSPQKRNSFLTIHKTYSPWGYHKSRILKGLSLIKIYQWALYSTLSAWSKPFVHLLSLKMILTWQQIRRLFSPLYWIMNLLWRILFSYIDRALTCVAYLLVWILLFVQPRTPFYIPAQLKFNNDFLIRLKLGNDIVFSKTENLYVNTDLHRKSVLYFS